MSRRTLLETGSPAPEFPQLQIHHANPIETLVIQARLIGLVWKHQAGESTLLSTQLAIRVFFFFFFKGPLADIHHSPDVFSRADQCDGVKSLALLLSG